MSGSAGRPPVSGRPRAPGVDEAVIGATVRRLIEDGYTGMSVARVATDAGTTRPSIYLRWPTKRELVIEAVRSTLQRPLNMLSDAWDTLPAQAKIIRLLEWLKPASEGSDSYLLYATLMAESQRIPELFDLLKEHLVEPRVQYVVAALTTMRERGEIRPDADLEHAAALLYGSLLIYTFRPGAAPVGVEERTLGLLWPALAPESDDEATR